MDQETEKAAESNGYVRVKATVRPVQPFVTCAGKHGHNPWILDCLKCVEEERDQYRVLLARSRVIVSMLMGDENAGQNQRECAERLWREINNALGDA